MQSQAESSGRAKTGKNIVLCCDGTGNEFIDFPDPKNSNSNVVKLYTTLKVDNDQAGYYHPGVGTAGDPTAKNWIAKKWSVLKGLAFAEGFKDNVMDAYRYLMETYDDGDRIYLIGFSRGSYTVRALAGLLDSYGLLCKGNEGHLPYAWNEYVKRHDNRKQMRVKPNHAFKETFSRKDFRIHFVGIWDTVSSVGWISTPVRLYSVAQNPTVKIGRHAISIDERRCFYRDNLWLMANEEQLASVATEEDRRPTQDLLQVWFPGVHSDVGGSYAQTESVLSNNPLKWLLREAKSAGANIKEDMVELVLGERIDQAEDFESARKIAALEDLYEKPDVSILHKSLRRAWWLLEVLPHRYYDADDGAENWRTPLGMRRRIPKGDLMHASVPERMQQPEYGYNPRNVNGGVESLHPEYVTREDSRELYYRYDPAQDPKPVLNETAVRWGVMIAVSALDLAAVGVVVTGAVWGLRKLWR